MYNHKKYLLISSFLCVMVLLASISISNRYRASDISKEKDDVISLKQAESQLFSSDSIQPPTYKDIVSDSPQADSVEPTTINEQSSIAQSISDSADVQEGEIDNTIPKKEKYYGFYLSSSENINFDDIKFRFISNNSPVSAFQTPIHADGFIGDGLPNKITASEVMTYAEGFDEIEFQGNTKNIQINYLTKSDVQMKASSAAVPAGAENTYKNKFFEALGFPNFYTREEWGAPTYSRWEPWVVQPNRFVIHHTATGVDNSDPSNMVRAIYYSHYYRCADNSGSYNPSNPTSNCNEPAEWWEDIGYNYLIDQNGNLYEGRAGGNGTIGAHAPPNYGSIGIAMIGTYSSGNVTAAARTTLVKLMATLSTFNNINLAWQSTVYGHRDYLNTECPGNVLYSNLPSIVQDANTVKASLTDLTTKMNEVNTKIDNLLLTVPEINGTYDMLVDKSSLPAYVSQKGETLSFGAGKTKDFGDSLQMIVSSAAIRNILRQIYLLSTNANIYYNTTITK